MTAIARLLRAECRCRMTAPNRNAIDEARKGCRKQNQRFVRHGQPHGEPKMYPEVAETVVVFEDKNSAGREMGAAGDVRSVCLFCFF